MEHPTRIRGTLGPFSSPLGPERTRTLHTLVRELRARSGHLPITVAVHGWGRLPAYEFLEALSSSLDFRNDAIWLVPDNQPEGIFPYPGEGTVLLDVTRDADLRIYRNLVADIVFFAAEHEEDTEQVARFRNRAHVVLIDERSSQWAAVRDAACEAMLVACLWSGENAVSECEKGESGLLPPEQLEPQPAPDLDEVGKRLQELTVELQNHPYRRYQFHQRLQEALDAYPDHPSWYEDLARQADKHGWPPWAVHCIPKVYIPLPDPAPERKAAIVWRYVLDCASDPQSYEATSLCGGELNEVIMVPQTADFLAGIARTIEENLYEMKLWGDRVFNNSVIEALQNIELNLRQRNFEAADRVQEVHKRLLAETRLPGSGLPNDLSDSSD